MSWYQWASAGAGLCLVALTLWRPVAEMCQRPAEQAAEIKRDYETRFPLYRPPDDDDQGYVY